MWFWSKGQTEHQTSSFVSWSKQQQLDPSTYGIIFIMYPNPHMSMKGFVKSIFVLTLAIPFLYLLIEVVSKYKTLTKDSNDGVRKGFL